MKVEAVRAAACLAVGVTAAAFMALTACSSEGAGDGGDLGSIPFGLSVTSEQCGACHPAHYEQWRGSMHAYATTDPIFLAMNQLALDDTGGEIDQFCVGCHAPIASRAGLTKVTGGPESPTMATPDDPAFTEGVQCVSCHGVASVQETHNAKFTMSDSHYAGVAPSAAAQAAHPMQPSAILRSGELCGACHDVITDAGVAAEATYSEWFELYEGRTLYNLNCNSCHMSTYQGPVAVGGADQEVHSHTFVGVDQALSGDFPNTEAQGAAVASLLSGAASISVEPLGVAGDVRGYRVIVTNTGTGHSLPSGTSAERRVWVRFVAVDGAGAVLKESGMVGPDGNLFDRGPAAERDKDLLVFGQTLLGPDGGVVPFAWQAADAVSFMLEPGTSGHHDYEVDTSAAQGGELTVTATLRYRAFQPYFIAELVESGRLAEGAVTDSPIHDIATRSKTFSLR